MPCSRESSQPKDQAQLSCELQAGSLPAKSRKKHKSVNEQGAAVVANMTILYTLKKNGFG